MDEGPHPQPFGSTHPIVSRGKAGIFGLVGPAYYVAAGILALIALLLSFTIVPSLVLGDSEHARGWPQVLFLWMVACAFAECGRLFVRRTRPAFYAFVAGVMALLFPIGTAIGFATVWSLRSLPRTHAPTGDGRSLNLYWVALAGAGAGSALLVIASLLDHILKA